MTSEFMLGYVVISGDYDGDIKVFIKEGKVNFIPEKKIIKTTMYV